MDEWTAIYAHGSANIFHKLYLTIQTESASMRAKRRTEDVRKGVGFFRTAWRSPGSKVVISCDYGASRSPALAYVCIADQLGVGLESDALDLTLNIRPCAVPNGRAVRLGDLLLGRRGALVRPLRQLYVRSMQESGTRNDLWVGRQGILTDLGEAKRFSSGLEAIQWRARSNRDNSARWCQ